MILSRLHLSIAAFVLACATVVRADRIFPAPDWQDAPNPLASPHATPGGTISAWAGPYPQTLNYLLDNNAFASEVFGDLYDSLLSLNPVTADHEPAIADQWSISDDKKTFTFRIDPTAHWSDGEPITAYDVRWTYDA